jgi:hypothetical protein
MSDKSVGRVKKNLRRIVFAKAAIHRAIEGCDYVIKNNLSSKSPMYYQLVTAIFVLYARPFGDNDGMGRIPPRFAKYDSAEKMNLHEMLVHGRNKFYAHVDANSHLYDEKGQNPIGHLFRMNVIVDDMKDGTFDLRTSIIEPELTVETIPRIKPLAEDLLKTLCLEEKRLLEQLVEAGHQFTLGRNELSYE